MNNYVTTRNTEIFSQEAACLMTKKNWHPNSDHAQEHLNIRCYIPRSENEESFDKLLTANNKPFASSSGVLNYFDQKLIKTLLDDMDDESTTANVFQHILNNPQEFSMHNFQFNTDVNQINADASEFYLN